VLAVVAVASIICVGVSLLVLARARRKGRARTSLIGLALVTHSMLAVPGIFIVWQVLKA